MVKIVMISNHNDRELYNDERIVKYCVCKMAAQWQNGHQVDFCNSTGIVGKKSQPVELQKQRDQWMIYTLFISFRCNPLACYRTHTSLQ